jgi:hypothetical protein
MCVAVINIGKPGKNLGWAIDEPDEEGTDLDACIKTLFVSLGKGSVALGFEAPQFRSHAKRSVNAATYALSRDKT